MQDLYGNDGCSTKFPPSSSNFFVQYHHKRSWVQAHQPAVFVPSVSVSHRGPRPSCTGRKSRLLKTRLQVWRLLVVMEQRPAIKLVSAVIRALKMKPRLVFLNSFFFFFAKSIEYKSSAKEATDNNTGVYDKTDLQIPLLSTGGYWEDLNWVTLMKCTTPKGA